jgi:hypothetical protein
MATVHLARQLDLDRLVALKRLDGFADESDRRVRRFVREARLAASLSHPNVVTVHDAFEVDGVPYIAMEYVPGGTLRELLTGLSVEQIAGVLDGVLAGLVHAERRHIVHRDLKPENLMVTAEGGIKIADFGIAKATTAAHADGPLTTAGVAIGTPACRRASRRCCPGWTRACPSEWTRCWPNPEAGAGAAAVAVAAGLTAAAAAVGCGAPGGGACASRLSTHGGCREAIERILADRGVPGSVPARPGRGGPVGRLRRAGCRPGDAGAPRARDDGAARRPTIVRDRCERLEDVDVVTADLLHGVIASLEEQLWMIRVQAG